MSLDREAVGVGLVVIVERAGAGDECEPRRAVWLAEAGRARARAPDRDRINEEKAPATVGEDDHDIVALVEVTQPGEEQGCIRVTGRVTISVTTFGGSICWGWPAPLSRARKDWRARIWRRRIGRTPGTGSGFTRT